MEDELRDAIRKLCERYPEEYWQGLDRERAYPVEFVGALNDAGYLACMIPEEFGGPGLGIREAATILEEAKATERETGCLTCKSTPNSLSAMRSPRALIDIDSV